MTGTEDGPTKDEAPPAPSVLLAPLRAMMGWLRRLYDWTLDVAGRPRAIWWLGFISFIESIFLPIPVDAPLAAAVLARPERWFSMALMATVTGALGGVVGYGIGAWFFEALGAPLLQAVGRADSLSSYRALFDREGWLIVFGGAFTPIPYKVIAIAAGLGGYNIALFLVASLVGRGVRFFLVAWLIHRFGEPIRGWIERRFGMATTLLFIVVVLGVIGLRWIFA